MNELEERIYERIGRLMPQSARWAYWQSKGGPMFVYNTERINLADPRDIAHGKFESAVFMPHGPGARSGKATEFRKLEGSGSLHELRRDAKDRAYRLYEEWLETGRVEA